MTKQETIRSRKLFLFELDGTLCLGDELFDFTLPLLRRIRETGRRYLFLTNDSSLAVEDQLRRLKKLGILADRADLLTAAQAAARHLRQNHPGRRVYVCGTVSFKRELEQAGQEVTEDADRAEAILLGFDRELSFRKLRDVCRLLQTRDIPYLAANPDLLFPTPFGAVPDCGSVCDMLFTATGKRPQLIGLSALATERLGVPPTQICCITSRTPPEIPALLVLNDPAQILEALS